MESAQHAKKKAAVVLLFWGGFFCEAVPVETIGPLGQLKRAIETPKRTNGVDPQREQIRPGIEMCKRNSHWADLPVSGTEAEDIQRCKAGLANGRGPIGADYDIDIDIDIGIIWMN